jgi:hypothetical protein
MTVVWWRTGLSGATLEKETSQSDGQTTIGNRKSSDTSGCPVSLKIGKFFGFLVEKATTPKTFGAIKGAHRRPLLVHKHSKSTLQL